MSKTLVAYFSATGATRRTAMKIAELLKADTFEIKPAIEYTAKDLVWTDKNSRSSQEMHNDNYRPPILNKLPNPQDYDTILIGFPIWWYKAPTIINTFIEETRLEGKIIYIFATSGATPVDKSFKDLKRKYHDHRPGPGISVLYLADEGLHVPADEL